MCNAFATKDMAMQGLVFFAEKKCLSKYPV